LRASASHVISVMLRISRTRFKPVSSFDFTAPIVVLQLRAGKSMMCRDAEVAATTAYAKKRSVDFT
jgi:hypothetical protein